jgi:hypothetical protein
MKYFIRQNSSFPSPVPPLPLDDSASKISRELRWTDQKFSTVNIIAPYFSMLGD